MLLKRSTVFCLTFVVCLASSESESNIQNKSVDQKSLSKRGIHSFGTFGHPYGGVHYTDYTLPPAIPFYDKRFVHKPILVPSLQIVHGGAAVTSYSSNYPQYLYHQKPFHHIPLAVPKSPFTPTLYPSSFNPLYASSIPNIVPISTNFGFLPEKPNIPIAVPVSGQFNKKKRIFY